MAIWYEVNAYNDKGEQLKILCGKGKRGKNIAVENAKALFESGAYTAVSVDANNGTEIIDNECIEFYK